MKIKNLIKEWSEALFYAAIIAALLYFICWPFTVDGSSMEKTLYSGDRIVISRLYSFVKGYKSGDIVVCKTTIEDSKKNIVKRVIAVPGEHIKIQNGKVFINDQEESFLFDTETLGNINVTLSEEEFFLLGDNRAVSMDSRMIGPVKKEEISGIVVARWYPFSSFKNLLTSFGR